MERNSGGTKPGPGDFGDDMIKWFYDQYNKQNA